MGKNKRSMHDAGGKKIMHPADAQRHKMKKKWREQKAQRRKKFYESAMLTKDAELIEAEIADYKEMEAAGKLTKAKKDRMTREMAFYGRLKDQVKSKQQKRLDAQRSDPMFIDFEELKVHRKASVFYHPTKNPYGAPPTGATLMYRHPDGSVKREPPPLDAPGTGPAADAEDSDEESSSSEEDSGEGQLDVQMGEEGEEGGALPPGAIGPQPESASVPPGFPPGMAPGPSSMPPLPPGMPPGVPPGPGLPPLPPGLPPGVAPAPGLPPLPPGLPPGMAPAPGLPPLPPGLPPGVSPAPGLPPLPPGLPPDVFAGPGLPPLPPGMPPLVPPLLGCPPFQPELAFGTLPGPFGVDPGAGLPPLPPGLPPGVSPAPGLPPLPLGLPPLPPVPPVPGLPPLPLDGPPGPPGSSAKAPPDLPPGLAPKAAPLPFFSPLGTMPAGEPQSQADFAAEMHRLGFSVPGLGPPGPPEMAGLLAPSLVLGPPGPFLLPGPPLGLPGGFVDASGTALAPVLSKAGPLEGPLPPERKPPGPPPKAPERKPPGPPPKAKAKAKVAPPEAERGKPEEAGGKQEPKPQSIADLPAGAKAPPPPPKKKAAGPPKSSLRAATTFTPTTLRSKKPSQIAGGVVQVSSASLSQEARKRVLLTEKPAVAERVNMDDAFDELMAELGDD